MERIESTEQLAAWCKERGFRCSQSAPDRPPRLDKTAKRVQVSSGSSVSHRVLQAHLLLRLPDPLEKEFTGGGVWLTRWNIWSEQVEVVGLELARALWEGRDLSVPMLLGADEGVRAQAMLAIPLLFEWDATFVSEDGSYAVEIDHEGRILVYSDREDLLSSAADRLVG